MEIREKKTVGQKKSKTEKIFNMRRKKALKNESESNLNKIKRVIQSKTWLTVKWIFEEADVVDGNREKICKILSTLEKDVRATNHRV